MTTLLPLFLLLTSLVPSAITFFLDQESYRLRNALNLGGAVAKVALIVAMLFAVGRGAAYETEILSAAGPRAAPADRAAALLFVFALRGALAA